MLKQKIENNVSIDKRMLWRYVNKKINRIIHHYHVFGVLSILFDEVIKDLKLGKIIKIDNFGSLVLKDLPPRRYFNINQQQVMLSQGHRILRFTLAAPIRKKLTAQVDLDRMIKGD